METLNLSDDGDGMTTLPPPQPQPKMEKPSTSFQGNEKNVAQEQSTMDSTPLSEIMDDDSGSGMGMMDAPMVQSQPRVQSVQMQAPSQIQPGMAQMMQQQQQQPVKPESKNPMNLTDDQMVALLVAVCAAAAVSKPVQDKLATSVPKFLTENGTRSMVGLGATGLVAAVLFYFSKSYVIKA
jgi:hypothetical protein